MGSAKSAAGVVLGTVGAASVVNKLTGGRAKAEYDKQRAPLLAIEQIKPKVEPQIESLSPSELSGQGEIKKPVSVLFERVFHNLSEVDREETRKLIEEMKAGLTSRTEYAEMLKVTKQYGEEIRRETSKRDIMPEIGLGIVLIEDGGVDKISEDDARGIAQLMPNTARDYGMRVDYGWKAGGTDERTNPAESIKVMAMYLRDNKAILGGDEGLAIWSYHAGVGKVMEALRNYFMNTLGIDVGDYARAFVNQNNRELLRIQNEVGELILEHKVNVHKVLTDSAVGEIVIPTLDEESELYVYKTVAAAELFEKRE